MNCLNVSYKKLWKLLVDKNMSKADLRKETELASATMTKMRRDQPVNLTVLLKIAEILNCDISDICEFVSEKEKEER